MLLLILSSVIKFHFTSTVDQDELHWLPIMEQIRYYVGLIAYKCLRQYAPDYTISSPNYFHPFLVSAIYSLLPMVIFTALCLQENDEVLLMFMLLC